MLKYFTAFIAIIPILCFCHNHDASLESILTIENDSVLQIIEDRIYLNPMHIVPTEQGMFLYSNSSEGIPLTNIYSDDQAL